MRQKWGKLRDNCIVFNFLGRFSSFTVPNSVAETGTQVFSNAKQIHNSISIINSV